mgnify:CR=1 FL=1
MDFKPIEYNYHKGLYNDNPKIEFGFYAQDVIDNFDDKGIDWHDYRLVSKDTVDISSEERKYLDDTCPDGIYRLSYNNMIAFNTHMTQKALRKIEALEERCSLLEEQNELKKQKEQQEILENRIKSKLEELNSSLETTKNRIDELQSKGTLSFVE